MRAACFIRCRLHDRQLFRHELIPVPTWAAQVMTGRFLQRGDRRSAEAIHVELEARASFEPCFSIAISAIYVGRREEEFEYALSSSAARDGIGLMWVRFPDFEPVLSHSRCREILAAMGA